MNEENKKTKKITLNHVTKVEGHAEVDIKITDGRVEKAHVHSIEGARYFEGIIKGRKFDEITLITSRICGICSCGHTIASISAIEDAFGMEVSKQTELLRELVTIGERIRSHVSHIYFFSLPDYLGYSSAIDMAKDYNTEVKDCLEIVRVGNELVKLLGGRDMHPYVPVVGGFTKIPKKEELSLILDELKGIISLSEETVKLFASLKVPNYKREGTVFVSLDNHESFPLHNGEIVTSEGGRFDKNNHQDFMKEYFHDGSSAKFAIIEGKEYMTGALARINNSFNMLSPKVKEMITELNLNFPSNNLFDNNLAQALEIVHWVERAINILENYAFKDEKPIEPELGNKDEYRGIGVIEVPRGILFHDYKFNKEGILINAEIITPTVQNLADMEIDLQTFLNEILEKEPDKKKEDLQLEIEKMIRAFDPCFSCSTHFLKVNWE